MIYLFSDVHLGLGSAEKSREREMAVVSFLEHARRERIDRLFIVGDLFDYWFDYRTVIPRGFTRTLGAIATVVDAGIPVDYVIGNHDFGHRDFFESEIGVTVHGDDIERNLHGRRTWISHGDGKAFNDRGYEILKRVLRARSSGLLFRMLHPDIGIGVAQRASKKSRDHTNAKNYDGIRAGEIDGLAAFAKEKIEREGYELVVMGHAHRAQVTEFHGGTYVNLGTWMGDRRTYLAIDDDRLELREWRG